MKIVPYNSSFKSDWDSFVDSSKNGTFLLKRDYMEYHSDRFKDHSFLLYDDRDRICALFPANISGNIVISHEGLTYGGLVMGRRTSGGQPIEMLQLLKQYFEKEEVKKLVYKSIPHIYHRYGAEEDLYALFRLGAKLKIRNLATVIDLTSPFRSSRLIKRAITRQQRWDIKVEETMVVDPFWNIIVDDRWSRHKVRPVHCAKEMNYLKSKFPENIRFYTALGAHEEILGGAVVYVDNGVIHLQYAACSQKGKDVYATDIIYHDLIFHRLKENKYFDFGTSNEDDGHFLNEGMVKHKEEFGGRSVVYDIYELDI